MTSIEEQIQNLLDKLQTAEDIDPLYTDEETKELRHKILHIHARVEKSLEILLANYLLITVDNEKVSQSERIAFFQTFTKIIGNSDFSKKVNAVQAEKLLDSKLIGKIFALNQLRVIFSHPSAYQDEIKEYRRNLAKQLETLKLLEAVYEEMNDVVSKGMKMAKKQREEFEKTLKE